MKAVIPGTGWLALAVLAALVCEVAGAARLNGGWVIVWILVVIGVIRIIRWGFVRPTK